MSKIKTLSAAELRTELSRLSAKKYSVSGTTTAYQVPTGGYIKVTPSGSNFTVQYIGCNC